jgi:hypothetical protein
MADHSAPDPGRQPAGSPRQGGWAGIRHRIDRMVAGEAPSDPLYISNRSFLQRFGIWFIVAIPCVAIVVVFALLSPKPAPTGPPPKELSRKELAAKLVPGLADLKVSSNTDVELSTVTVNYKDFTLNGSVKNTTERTLKLVKVYFDVVDLDGSQLTVVALEVPNLAAGASSQFSIPTNQERAGRALVREIQTQ